MREPAAIVVTVLLAVAATLSLVGCSNGPARGADGRVTSTGVIDSTTLKVGDCFSFVDGSNLAKATVTPCAESHTYIAIGDGSLTAAQVSSASTVQDAVSAACADPFKTFKATLARGVKTEQQFIVATEQVNGAAVTSYHCVATDTAPHTASTPTPSATPAG
jgi:hypothetical protein